jgi:outer membrane protein OmpA-like peptidoglycan-associated protein
MRFFLLTSLYLLLGFSSCYAQDRYNITSANADCSGLIDLLMPKDTVFGPTTAPSGPGNSIEISGEATSLYAFEQEHNTVWYRFRIPEESMLTFTITPINIKDDYDFILFKYSGKNFCADVSSKTLNPVRTCISRNNQEKGRITGLSDSASDEFMHSGIGPSYVKALHVKKGEIYILVVDNVYPGGSGHTLKFNFKPLNPQLKLEQETKTRVIEKSNLSVTLVDKETHDLVVGTARIYVKQQKRGLPISVFDSITSFNCEIDGNKTFVMKIEAIGYFDYSKEIATSERGENLNIQAELDKIVVGKNIIFDNILFYGNEARFLPESTPVLEGLANTMKKNPKLQVEVQGHVNCPTIWDACDDKKTISTNMNLSINRAKAVYEYLMQAGIDPARMTYQGYGASKMIYPDARSEEKQKMNRRVEIMIISN